MLLMTGKNNAALNAWGSVVLSLKALKWLERAFWERYSAECVQILLLREAVTSKEERRSTADVCPLFGLCSVLLDEKEECPDQDG